MIAPMSVDEIHKKLMQLLQENVKLKETLKQNNLAMKNQVQTLTKWYDEVLKVHKDHQKKFDKTREYINELKKENKVVKAQLAIKVDENMENKLKVYKQYVYHFLSNSPKKLHFLTQPVYFEGC